MTAGSTQSGSYNSPLLGLVYCRHIVVAGFWRFWSNRHCVSHAFHVQGSWGGSLPLSLSPYIRAHLPANLGGNLRPNPGRNLSPTLGRDPGENLTRNPYPTLPRNPGRNLGGNQGGNPGPNPAGNLGQTPSPTLGRNLGQNLPPNPGGYMGWLEFSAEPRPAGHLTG